MARQVNQVWNYCNETSYRAIARDGRWLRHFDFVRAPLKGTSLTVAETWEGDTHIPQLTVGEVGVLHPAGSIPADVSALARFRPAQGELFPGLGAVQSADHPLRSRTGTIRPGVVPVARVGTP